MTVIVVLSIFFLDQLSKLIVSNELISGESFPVLENIFHITLVYNRGAAFGMLKNQNSLFIFVSLIVIIMILLILRKRRNVDIFVISLSFILGGALGNLMDRILLGYVVDFLDFRIWPVFNLADSAVTIGAFLLCYSVFKKRG